MRDIIDGINEKEWERAMAEPIEKRDVFAIARYQRAIKTHQIADDKLSALLTAKYGKWAGDMRYRPAETVAIADAMKEKLQASEEQQTAWLATMK